VTFEPAAGRDSLRAYLLRCPRAIVVAEPAGRAWSRKLRRRRGLWLRAAESAQRPGPDRRAARARPRRGRPIPPPEGDGHNHVW